MIIPNDLRQYVIRRDRRCQQCGDNRRLQVDHVYPVNALKAFGVPYTAQNAPDNLQVLCADCNRLKSDLIPRKIEMRAVQDREAIYRESAGMHPFEGASRHHLVLLFGDLIQDHCREANDWTVWDNLEHKYDGHWQSRVFIYAIRGADEKLIERAVKTALRNAKDFWPYAEEVLGRALGRAPGDKSAAEMAGLQLTLDFEVEARNEESA